jgi:hypothetical protein
LLYIGKFHLNLFPFRDGIYSVAWPSNIIVPIRKHVGVCACIVISAFVITYMTEFIMETGQFMKVDSYQFYLYGFSDFLYPLVRSNQTFIVIPCIFYIKSYRRESRRGKFTIICYILVLTITPLITLITIFNWSRFY